MSLAPIPKLNPKTTSKPAINHTSIIKAVSDDKTGDQGALTTVNIAPNFGASTFGTTTSASPFAANALLNSLNPLMAPITIARLGFGAIGDGSGLKQNPGLPYHLIPNPPPSNLNNLMAQGCTPPIFPNQENSQKEAEEEEPQKKTSENKSSEEPTRREASPNPPASNPSPNTEKLSELKAQNKQLTEQVKKLSEKISEQKTPETKPNTDSKDNETKPDESKSSSDKKKNEAEKPEGILESFGKEAGSFLNGFLGTTIL